MDLKKLIEDLSKFDGKYKREEIDAVLAHRDEIMPGILELLGNILENPEKYANDPTYFGHIYAIMLLGHFKETRAHELILKIFTLPGDMLYDLFGDIVTENLPTILLNTCGGSFDGIKQLILNAEADEYSRSAASTAMAYAVAEGSLVREEVLTFFESILKNRRSEEHCHVYDNIAHEICSLYPEELMDLIKECYEDGYIDQGYIGISSFEMAMEIGKENCLKKLKAETEKYSLEDIHQAIGWWACFHENREIKPTVDAGSKKSSSLKKRNKKRISKASKKKNRRKK